MDILSKKSYRGTGNEHAKPPGKRVFPEYVAVSFVITAPPFLEHLSKQTLVIEVIAITQIEVRGAQCSEHRDDLFIFALTLERMAKVFMSLNNRGAIIWAITWIHDSISRGNLSAP